MYPLYETTEDEISIMLRASKHIPPHLHNAIEFAYVAEGTLELGVGTELFHMEEGDIGILFPDILHHYQVFSSGVNKAYYIQASPKRFGMFENELQQYCPAEPVIKRNALHSDIMNMIENLAKDESCHSLVKQSYIQVLLARLIPALDLGVSGFVLPRVFSGTFHTSFSQYVNEIRLNYACVYLENSNQSITQICMDCGFESQRTFNGVFKQRYHITPREYRNASSRVK